MTSVIRAPQDRELRQRIVDIIGAVQVPSATAPYPLVANKWIVFPEEPEALVESGEAIDVLRSPHDTVTTQSGETEELINAWIVEKKPRNPVKTDINPRGANQPARNNHSVNNAGGVGKVRVSYTFALGCVQSLRKGAMQHAAETGAVRREFNQLAKLGFTSPLDGFIDHHTGLTETMCDKEKFGSAWVFYSEFEITIHVFETYN